jgi:hypothetical protein
MNGFVDERLGRVCGTRGTGLSPVAIHEGETPIGIGDEFR